MKGNVGCSHRVPYDDAVVKLLFFLDERLDIGCEVFVRALFDVRRVSMIPQVLLRRCLVSTSETSGKEKWKGEVVLTRVKTSRPSFVAMPFARLLQFCLLPYKPWSTTRGAFEDDPLPFGSCDSNESLTGAGPELRCRRAVSAVLERVGSWLDRNMVVVRSTSKRDS